MAIYYEIPEASIYFGNCLDEIKHLADNSIDAIVTDPPYGLSTIDAKVFTTTLLEWVSGNREYMPSGKGFMGQSWDAFVPPPAIWDECFRVLKPGGHILVFAGSRTQDLMGTSIRMAGFEIRDSLAWLYGSGFPKSYDVAKGVESMLTKGTASWNEFHTLNGTLDESGRDANGMIKQNAEQGNRPTAYESHGKLELDPTTEEAKKWKGWGTALKPAIEPIIMGRKPLSEKNVASNILKHGTGALNIDESRVGNEERTDKVVENGFGSNFMDDNWVPSGKTYEKTVVGRWPANIILSHSAECLVTVDGFECEDGCPVKELDAQSGVTKSGTDSSTGAQKGTGGIWTKGNGIPVGPQYGDKGGASRFFYVAKTSKKDRNEGLDKLPKIQITGGGGTNADIDEEGYLKTDGMGGKYGSIKAPKQNFHPTVKPTALMEYLIKLVTPPGGTVLDPFTGSGSTGKAAIRNGFNFIGIEMTEEYLPIIKARIEYEIEQKGLF